MRRSEKVVELQQISKYRQWRRIFLATLRATGNVMLSCQSAHISKVVAYRLKNNNQIFRKQWEEAEDDAIETLEAIARKRAAESSDVLLIFLLKAHRPEKYREVYRVEHTVIQDEVKRLAAETGLSAEAIEAEFRALTGDKSG